MTSSIKRHKLGKFAGRLSGCVFSGKAVVLLESIYFSKLRVNSILFHVDRLDRSCRPKTYVEVVCYDGNLIFERVVSILSRTKEDSGSGQCQDPRSFCTQALKYRSVPLDLSASCVVARSFSCVELTKCVEKVNAFHAKVSP